MYLKVYVQHQVAICAILPEKFYKILKDIQLLNVQSVMINALTGFKFIDKKIQQFQEDHSHTFMFSFEESHGYLAKPFVRDKDAIQALVLLEEVAVCYKRQVKTLYYGFVKIKFYILKGKNSWYRKGEGDLFTYIYDENRDVGDDIGWWPGNSLRCIN